MIYFATEPGDIVQLKSTFADSIGKCLMKSLQEKGGIHILPEAFNRLFNFQETLDMRQLTSKDICFKV